MIITRYHREHKLICRSAFIDGDQCLLLRLTTLKFSLNELTQLQFFVFKNVMRDHRTGSPPKKDHWRGPSYLSSLKEIYWNGQLHVAVYYELINQSRCRIWGYCKFPKCVQWLRWGSLPRSRTSEILKMEIQIFSFFKPTVQSAILHERCRKYKLVRPRQPCNLHLQGFPQRMKLIKTTVNS